MAKTKLPVQKDLLEESIRQCEINGSFTNRSQLWEAVANHYNTTVKPIRKITAAVVYQRVREWDIPVNTQKGKAGRGVADGSSAPVTRSGDTILCALTPFKTSLVERGRAIGNTTTSRIVIALDKRNWILAKEVEGSPSLMSGKFSAKISDIILSVKRNYPDISGCREIIINALKEKTGINVNVSEDDDIDEIFQTSHFRHDDVYKRLAS